MKTTLVPCGTRLGLFDDFQREFDGLFGQLLPEKKDNRETCFSPTLNLAETDSAFEVTLDVPGLTPDAFNIEFKDGHLLISGEHSSEKEDEKEKKWHRIERRTGRFRRVVQLGNKIDSDNVDAEYKDGVLQIIVPKAAEAKSKRIAVKG